jgi:paraquat-inducible protein B
MSQRANPTFVGVFVLGALFLTVVGLVVFGSGRLFSETHPFVLYFSGDVNGLNIGSPVKFKGVQIGSVSQVLIRLDAKSKDARIPVVIEIDSGRLRKSGVTEDLSDDSFRNQVISDGLRGQLVLQSFVTGVLYINLAYFPDTPLDLAASGGDYPELPTVPTTEEKVETLIKSFSQYFADLDLDALIKSILRTVHTIDRLISSEEATDLIPRLDSTLKEIQDLAKSVRSEIEPLSTSFKSSLERLRSLSEEAEVAVKVLRGALAHDAPLSVELEKSLEEIAASARAFRALAETLERDPGILLRGRDFPRSER